MQIARLVICFSFLFLNEIFIFAKVPVPKPAMGKGWELIFMKGVYYALFWRYEILRKFQFVIQTK